MEIGQIHPVPDDAHHGAVFPLIEGEHGEFAHAAGKVAVGKTRGAPTLDVAQDGQANFLPEAIPGGGEKAAHEILAAADPLGDHHHAVVVAAEAAAGEVIDDFFEVVLEFGNDGDLGAGGDGAHEGEVPLLSSHHLDDEAAVVRSGGGFDHVDEVNDGVQAGVRADAKVGIGDVVVDGAGQAEDAVSVAGEGGGAGQRAVPAENKQSLDVFLFEDLDGLLLGGFLFEFEATAGGKDGAGIADPAADLHAAESHEFAVKDALVTVLDSDHFDPKTDPGPDDGPDGGIHSRGVPPGGDDADTFEHGRLTMPKYPQRGEYGGFAEDSR